MSDVIPTTEDYRVIPMGRFRVDYRSLSPAERALYDAVKAERESETKEGDRRPNDND